MKQFLTLLFILSGFALTAQTIAVQGVLRDPRGRTVDDGFYEVVFSIYDQRLFFLIVSPESISGSMLVKICKGHGSDEL